MKLRFVGKEERNGAHCYFCGNGTSVKYATEIYNPLSKSREKIGVYMCNRCALWWISRDVEE